MKHRGLNINEKCIFPFNQIDKSVVEEAKSLLNQILNKYTIYKEST